MKKIALLLLSVVVLLSCATTVYDSAGNPISKEQLQKMKAMAVSKHLRDRRYRIFVDKVYPMRGPSFTLMDTWGIEVSGDSIGLFLPYFGRIYQVPFDRRMGLHFIAPLETYQEEITKKGVRIKMQTGSGIEHCTITMEVYANGQTDLQVNSSNREPIRYLGELQLNDAIRMKAE
ncbi:UNVERIFIED_CONTAM: DUF4251 domain-containing protein [Prevotella sp. 15_C9]